MTNDAAPATRFVSVPDLASLEDLLSRAGLVVLFLHAPHCSISVRAYREVTRLGGEVALVDVARDRSVTRAVAARTGLRHESPQLIVLRGGSPVWSASHFGITAAAVARALVAASRGADLRPDEVRGG